MIYFYFICSQKRQFQPKLILINNIPIVLLVINHTEMLLLNNHLYNKRDIIKNVLVSIYSANIEVNQAQVLSKFSDLIKGISFSWRPQCIF